MDQPRDEFICLEQNMKFKIMRPAGRVVGLFLAALRDEKKIIGSECRECGKVFVPPASYCERCSSDTYDLREVGPRGVVISWTRVSGGFYDSPADSPFRYIMVRLMGADTPLLHISPDDERIQIGAVVRPVFLEERTGSITDIKWFVPDDEEIRA
ncbi:MAG: OB-fold domain-containing protein [Actinobacteria bacterium]|nr:OB-fold domain-containing protein [Actinomycetota bacterium]